MRPRDVLLAATLLAGFVVILAAVDLSAAPGFRAWLAAAGRALLESDAVKFLLVSAAILFLLSVIVVAYDTAEKRRSRRESEQARARALREERVRQTLTDQLDKPRDRGPWAA